MQREIADNEKLHPNKDKPIAVIHEAKDINNSE